MIPKYISARDLATIVSTLLLHPERVGELQDREQFATFVGTIAEVVTQACGGVMQEVIPPQDVGDGEAPDVWRAVIRPDDCLPSLDQNIWTMFDVEAAWGGSIPSGDDVDAGMANMATVVDASHAEALKDAIHQLRRDGSHAARMAVCDLAATALDDASLSWHERSLAPDLG